MLNKQQPIINGDGEQTRDFVYVEDIARANILAMQSNTSDDVFNIGTGVETNINQIFDNLVTILNLPINKRYAPAKQGEQLRSVIECTKTKKTLQWLPETSLFDGLKKTCDYFQNT